MRTTWHKLSTSLLCTIPDIHSQSKESVQRDLTLETRNNQKKNKKTNWAAFKKRGRVCGLKGARTETFISLAGTCLTVSSVMLGSSQSAWRWNDGVKMWRGNNRSPRSCWQWCFVSSVPRWLCANDTDRDQARHMSESDSTVLGLTLFRPDWHGLFFCTEKDVRWWQTNHWPFLVSSVKPLSKVSRSCTIILWPRPRNRCKLVWNVSVSTHEHSDHSQNPQAPLQHN